MITRRILLLLACFQIFHSSLNTAQAVDLNGKACRAAIMTAAVVGISGFALMFGSKMLSSSYSGLNFADCTLCNNPPYRGVTEYLHAAFHGALATPYVDLRMDYKTPKEIRRANESLKELDFMAEYLWKIVSQRFPNTPAPLHQYKTSTNWIEMQRAEREFISLLNKLEQILPIQPTEPRDVYLKRVGTYLLAHIDLDSPEIMEDADFDSMANLRRIIEVKDSSVEVPPSQVASAIISYGKVTGELPLPLKR